MAEPSYASGVSTTPLLGETIGENLDRTVARFGERDALVECATGRAASDVRGSRPRMAHEVSDIQACRLSEAASLTIRPEPDSVHRSSPITSARVTPAR